MTSWLKARRSGQFPARLIFEKCGVRDGTAGASTPVGLLADHLDAALAAGEDLMARGGDWRALTETPASQATSSCVSALLRKKVRSFELIVARILKARAHASSLAECDDRFRAIAKLFVSGTAILPRAVEEAATPEPRTRHGRRHRRLRSQRGLIAPDAPAIRVAADLTIGDNFLVVTIALGPLLDMAAAFLDALDVQCGLFGDAPTTSNTRTADADERAGAAELTRPAAPHTPKAALSVLAASVRQS